MGWKEVIRGQVMGTEPDPFALHLASICLPSILFPVGLGVTLCRGVGTSWAKPSPHPRRERNSAEPSLQPLQGLGGADAAVWSGLEGHVACGGEQSGVETGGSLEETLLLGCGGERDGQVWGTVTVVGGQRQGAARRAGCRGPGSSVFWGVSRHSAAGGPAAGGSAARGRGTGG